MYLIIIIVNKTHFVKQKNAKHFNIINKIQRVCNYVIKIA